MIHFKNNHSKTVFLLFGLLISFTALFAQTEQRVQPKWWFGYSVAANINQYNGTTQMLNASTTVPTAFHKGKSVRPYASFLLEYRPNKVVGFMLNLAYDNRSARFNQVMAPCNCPADLSTNLSYFSIEPSLRLAPFSSAFYLFAGPTIGININKDFVYVETGDGKRQRRIASVPFILADARTNMTAPNHILADGIPGETSFNKGIFVHFEEL